MQSLLSKFLMLFFLLSIIQLSWSKGQSFPEDLLLLNNQKTEINQSEKEMPEKSFLQKINPLKILYDASLGFYQKNISVQIAANCVFEKTCSHFSKDLTQEFGILPGVILSLDRLSRCNRISIMETSPLNFSEKGKIKESLDDYRF